MSGDVKRKVLIVDDEDMTRVLLTHVVDRLKLDGLEILLAEDGEEAFEIAVRERPSLILLDVLLPKLNGYEVCRQIRAIPDYKPYIIILTARGHSADRERAETYGADDFMTKPFNPSRLTARLSQIWQIV